MRLLEYHAKSIFQKEGLPVPKSVLLLQLSDVSEAAQSIGLPMVMKVQTLSGGRGKAGGIQIVHTEAEAEQWFIEKNGSILNGKKVEGILAEKLISFEAEYYAGFTLDTHDREIKMLFSANGGIHVEESRDSRLFTCKVPMAYGLDEFRMVEILSRAKVPQNRWSPLMQIMRKLYALFLQYDCMLLEVNPLVWTREDEVCLLDVHMYVDDHAIPRQAAVHQIVVDLPEVYPQMWHKINYGFDFVLLNPNGSVGLLMTGAGLTMATLDELSQRNIQPINFSDIRSGQLKGNPARLILILEQFTKKPNLRSIFVSIFAGITDLAEFAATLLEAKNQVLFANQVDWVIRLEGNHFSEAKRLLEAAGLFVTDSLEEAFQRIETGVMIQ